MSASQFTAREHRVPAQHVRQYEGGTRNDENDDLWLTVKQYTPVSNTSPRKGDVTIVATHANGYPKELFEPIWDELLQHSNAHGYGIRNIWALDAAHEGYSGETNEDKLGNDPSWFDFSFDLLQVINTFRTEMSHPLIGIGHSMGASAQLYLASIHPRLFTSVVSIEPVVRGAMVRPDNAKFPGPSAPQLSSVRRDIWPSRDAAREGFGKSAFFKTWDPRVFDLYIKHGLRNLPSRLYPGNESRSDSSPSQSSSDDNSQPQTSVTLRTTKHQEVFSFIRPNLPLDEKLAASLSAEERKRLWKLQHPGVSPEEIQDLKFYRTESHEIYDRLPVLRPSVLYIFGEESRFSEEEERAKKMKLTGTSSSGSGGAAEGRVDEVLMQGVGHLVPFERVTAVAEASAGWIGKEVRRWHEDQALLARFTEAEGDQDKSVLSRRVREELSKGLPKRRSGAKDSTTKL